MATRIESLFGIQNPQDSYQNYLQGMMVSPQQMGSQGLYQQLISTMANAGAGIGGGIGRMLGGRTSEEVRSAQINDAFKNVSGQKFENDWEKFDALAKELESKGMWEDAARARKEARTMEATGLTTQKARKDLRETPKIVNRSKLVPSTNPVEKGKMVQQTESFIEYKGALYSFDEFQKQHPELAKGLTPAQEQPAGAGGGKAGPGGLTSEQQTAVQAALAAKKQQQEAAGAAGVSTSGTSPFAGATPAEQKVDFNKKFANAKTTAEQRMLAEQAYYRGIITKEELYAIYKNAQSVPSMPTPRSSVIPQQQTFDPNAPMVAP